MKDPVWRKMECGGGARWTVAHLTYGGEICNVSGCNCGTKVRKVGETADRTEASKWFRYPLTTPN